MIAAAATGEMNIAISGTESWPSPPPSPLLEIPVISTARSATARNAGSGMVSNTGVGSFSQGGTSLQTPA